MAKRFVTLTVLECREPTIDIAGPEGPATWTERAVTFHVDAILRMERVQHWGRAITRVTTSDSLRFNVAETPEWIIREAAE